MKKNKDMTINEIIEYCDKIRNCSNCKLLETNICKGIGEIVDFEEKYKKELEIVIVEGE